MSDSTCYWRVTFFADGRVNKVRPIKSPGHSRWIVVEAPDEETAKRKGFNIYCARKKRERTAVLHAEKRCVCGRPQDRLVERGKRKGEQAMTCSVCAERRAACHQQAKEHPGRTREQAVAERDESARVASNLSRQRDRRAEIRLETLIEVREQWIAARNVGLYGQWLTREIEALTKGQVST